MVTRFNLNRKKTIGLGVAIAFLFILFTWYMLSKPAKQVKPAPTRVVVATAQSKNVPLFLNALGAVTPTDTVTVKTQINGKLEKVFFKEGQMVKSGNVLALIDPRPYQAILKENEGQLARDRALLENARLDLKRYKALWKQDSVSKQTLDTQAWLVKQYEGTVKSDEGLVQSARVNLNYCKITTPINGRVGLRLVDPGNYVQTSDTNGLFVINNVNPITVVFTLPEDNIPQVVKQIRKNIKLPTEAYNRNQTVLLATGTLMTIDNQIDPSTGTVKLKAQFKNADDALFPNQFVNIKLLVEHLKNITVIPTPAIQHGVKGDFIYCYNEMDKTVHINKVNVGPTIGDETVIYEGVVPGELVVVDGTDKLTDGSAAIISQERTK